MRRSTFISFTLHALIILAAILTLPTPTLPPSTGDEVSVQWGPSTPTQGQKGKGHAPAKSDHRHVAPKAPTPKVDKQIVAPPPPPPPPPQSEKAPQKAKPPTQPPPPPPRTTAPAQAPATPPPQKTQANSTSTSDIPLPPPPMPQPPMPSESATHQRHQVQTPVPQSEAVLNTRQFLQSLQKQDKAPTALYNPDAGVDTDVGGNPDTSQNSMLSNMDKGAIASHVKPCFDVDPDAENLSSLSVNLVIVTDSTGVIRTATVAPGDEDKMTDTTFAAFANRAITAALDYRCSDLSSVLPPSMMGQNHTFLFDFVGQ